MQKNQVQCCTSKKKKQPVHCLQGDLNLKQDAPSIDRYNPHKPRSVKTSIYDGIFCLLCFRSRVFCRLRISSLPHHFFSDGRHGALEARHHHTKVCEGGTNTALCGNQSSLVRSPEITQSKLRSLRPHRIQIMAIQRQAMTLSCRQWKGETKGETDLEWK